MNKKTHVTTISFLDVLLDILCIAGLVYLLVSKKEISATLVIVIALVVVALSFIKDIFLHFSVTATVSSAKEGAKYVWKDRKRTFLGLPFSFTRYRLTKEKILLDEGFFNRKENEVRLYRVMDLSLNRNFGQRLLGIGTITVTSSDKSLPLLELKNIKKSEFVKELISKLVEEERQAKRVTGREIIDQHTDDPEDSDSAFFDPMI